MYCLGWDQSIRILKGWITLWSWRNIYFDQLIPKSQFNSLINEEIWITKEITILTKKHINVLILLFLTNSVYLVDFIGGEYQIVQQMEIVGMIYVL